MNARDAAIHRGLEAKTMLDAPQLGWLYDLAQRAPDGPAVETGVYRGGSLVTWAAAREGRGRIIAVDTWSSDKAPPTLRDLFMLNMKRCSIPIELLEVNSWEAPALIKEPVAFCFIDSDHGIYGIPRDILTWPDAIMPGGILAFHDYDVWKPTVVVQCIVDAWALLSEWEDLGLVGSAKAYRKPERK